MGCKPLGLWRTFSTRPLNLSKAPSADSAASNPLGCRSCLPKSRDFGCCTKCLASILRQWNGYRHLNNSSILLHNIHIPPSQYDLLIFSSPTESPFIMSYAGCQLRADRRNREILVRNEETLEPAPTSRSQSHSASPHRNIRNRLSEKEAETNLLNFVDFLSEQDVNVERDIPLNDAKLVGLGSTMEVHSTTWKGQQVALKRMRRDRMPNRSANLPSEHDTAFAVATEEFYNDVKSIMQEILVMSRVSKTHHMSGGLSSVQV